MPRSLAPPAHAIGSAGHTTALLPGRDRPDRLPGPVAALVILALSAAGWVLVIHATRLAAGMLG